MKHYTEHKVPVHVEEHIHRELDKITCDHCGNEIPQEKMHNDLDEIIITRRHGFVCEEDCIETNTYDVCDKCFEEYILPLFEKKKKLKKTSSVRSTRVRSREEMKHLITYLKTWKNYNINNFSDFKLVLMIPTFQMSFVRMKIHAIFNDEPVGISENKLAHLDQYFIRGANGEDIVTYSNANMVEMRLEPFYPLHFAGEAQVWWNDVINLLITAFELIIKKDE